MVQLFKKMFRQKEPQQAEHPPSQQQYDEDYIIYCIEQEQLYRILLEMDKYKNK